MKNLVKKGTLVILLVLLGNITGINPSLASPLYASTEIDMKPFMAFPENVRLTRTFFQARLNNVPQYDVVREWMNIGECRYNGINYGKYYVQFLRRAGANHGPDERIQALFHF